ERVDTAGRNTLGTQELRMLLLSYDAVMPSVSARACVALAAPAGFPSGLSCRPHASGVGRREEYHAAHRGAPGKRPTSPKERHAGVAGATWAALDMDGLQ